MPDIQVEVRQAQPADAERIQHLQQFSSRVCVRYGQEDLRRMIERDYCFIADTGPLLWGVCCAALRQPGLAQVRGVSLVNGWRVDVGVARLLASLEAALQRDGVPFLMHLGLESWLVEPLARCDFAASDYIVNFERAIPPQRLTPEHRSRLGRLRALRPDEIGDLARLDQRSFAWPWQFSSGELIQLLMTTSRLVVIEYQDILAGYACTDVLGAQAQIVRLGVDPVYWGMGLGRYLLADALDFAAQAGAKTVTLNTQWQNQASQRLYRGFGFRVVGRRIPVLLKRLHG